MEGQSNTTTAEAVLTRAQQELQALYGPRLKGLILFGSRARQTHREDSDIDLAVILEGPLDAYREIQRTGLLRAAINLETGHLLSCVYLTPESLAAKNSPFSLNLAREGKTLNPPSTNELRA